MHLLSLAAISKSYPENPVLEHVSLGISAGERIGVIGRNGSGKSTLLALIAGTEEPDEGSIIRASGLRIAQLDQDPSFGEGDTIGGVLLETSMFMRGVGINNAGHGAFVVSANGVEQDRSGAPLRP